MGLRIRLGTVLALAGLLSGISVWADGPSGGMDSGGGDLRAIDAGSAWFLGADREIRYCVQTDAGFGVDRAFAERVIAESILKWQRYLVERSPDRGRDVRMVLTNKFKLVAPCQGDEDLSFFMGIENARVQAAKKHYFNPAGIAEREQYDLSAGWGKGLIWIRPAGTLLNYQLNWQREGALGALVLHELGHVFGIQHVERTVMSENIVRHIHGSSVNTPAGQPLSVNSIDGTRVVYIGPNDANAARLPGKFNEFDSGLFERLFQRPLVGKVVSELVWGWSYADATHQMRLRITDDVGTQEITVLVPGADEQEFENPGRSFCVARYLPDWVGASPYVRTCKADTGGTFLPTLVLPNGERVLGQLNFNMKKFVTIAILDGLNRRNIFEGMGRDLVAVPKSAR